VFAFFRFFENTKYYSYFQKNYFSFFYAVAKIRFSTYTFHRFSFFIFRLSFFILHIIAAIFDCL
jgi:hypothetical protein